MGEPHQSHAFMFLRCLCIGFPHFPEPNSFGSGPRHTQKHSKLNNKSNSSFSNIAPFPGNSQYTCSHQHLSLQWRRITSKPLEPMGPPLLFTLWCDYYRNNLTTTILCRQLLYSEPQEELLFEFRVKQLWPAACIYLSPPWSVF